MARETTAELLGLIEEKGIAPVSVAEAHGSPRATFGLWMAANVQFGTLVTGALATGWLGLSATAAFGSIVLANVIGALVLAIFSTFGVAHGLPQMIQGTAWFGRRGNKLPSLFNFVGGFSWFAVNTIVGASALDHFIAIGVIPAVILLALVQVGIALIGHDLIQTAERYFFYLLTLIFLALTVVAVGHLGIDVPARAASMAKVGGPSGAFLISTSIMIGYMVSWVPYSSDYTRYLRTDNNAAGVQRTVATHVFWGALISTVWIEALGALIGASIEIHGASDLFTDWMPGWLQAPLLVAAIVGTISANVLNIYSATMSALALGIRLKQHQAALLTGAIGTLISVLAAAKFITNYEDFLLVLGYWTMPWVAVGLLSHFMPRRARFAGMNAGFVAWVAAVVLSVPFWNQELYTGWFARSFPQCGDSTFIVGFVLAAVFYVGLTVPGEAVAE
jgi:NCS1 family nucleobase:cation symporter-1